MCGAGLQALTDGGVDALPQLQQIIRAARVGGEGDRRVEAVLDQMHHKFPVIQLLAQLQRADVGKCLLQHQKVQRVQSGAVRLGIDAEGVAGRLEVIAAGNQ